MIDCKKQKLFYILFQVNCDSTQVGETICVTGSLPSLGNWNADHSVQLTTNSNCFPVWRSKIQEIYCPQDHYEYKYLIKRESGNNTKWENFSANRVINIQDIENMAKHNIEYTVEIHDDKFGQFNNSKIFIGGLKENLKEIVEEASENRYETKEILEDRKISLEEKNKKFEYIDFKISDYLKSLIKDIVILNGEKKTWKDKLTLIHDLLSNQSLDKELMALCSIYLFYINSGQIKCAENGTHFRPNHHAGLAYSIFSLLIQNLTEDNSIIIRSILKNLPSFSDQYLVTVPLTRIRDIAHRNDIPRELKEEIKRTLQNKLHRSAAPEDLKTCENILKRITVPGSNFSEPFINEFKIFNEELKEFFNALGLEKAMNKFKEITKDEKLKDEIDKMIQLKYKETDIVIQKLNQIVKLRQIFTSIIKDEIASGGNINKSILQLSSTCEIELEDFAYTLISEYIDKYYYSNKKTSEEGYQRLIKISEFCLDNLILSNIKPEECKLIKDDLIYFSDGFQFESTNGKDCKHRLEALKLKSVFERCLNLFYEIIEDVETYFNIPVYSLGKAMEISAHSVRVFCESFVRGHTIFQFSKIITLLQAKTRDILKLPPFVTISTGEASGYYLPLRKLSDFSPDKYQEKYYIVLLNESDGSEEIPNVIKGIMISHDLPQLSHLAIRARQNKVAFVCCLDNAIYKYKYYKKFHSGDYLSLKVIRDEEINLEKVDTEQISKIESKKTIEVTEGCCEKQEEDEKVKEHEELLNGNTHKNHKDNVTVNNNNYYTNSDYILPIMKAERKIAGSKTFNMKLLTIKKKEYLTPESLFIPYSVYSKFINKILSPKDYNEIDNCRYEELESKSLQIREKIVQHSLTAGEGETGANVKDNNDNILNSIAEKINQMLPEDCSLAFRSSSNLEDLKKSAGAGLFDSYLGVKNSPSMNDEIKRDICKVWSSIFTVRGIIARRNNKVSSSKAKMGVLVQEMIDLNFSFVIHTVNPINRDKNEVYIEMAIGQGETLASGKQKGSPYRLTYKKSEGIVIINNFASFAHLIRNGTEQKRISYRNEILSTDDDYITEIGVRLGKISNLLESEFEGFPQDIEGGVLMDKIYIIQTRPQLV